ncbi:MAG: Diaminopimelate epimerase [Chlamydiae bacterium]|nr:Diaminopimelate epimerase [Chlamydiota bacterium]
MGISFSKYTGLGNDFIFIDNRTLDLHLDPNEIQRLCHRSLGIGGDGIVFLESSQVADYKMRIFNADGHEAEMCGNALRCFYIFLEELALANKPELLIETYDRLLKISKELDLVRCEMGEVKSLELNKSINLSQGAISGHFLNTGVPHFVILTNDLPNVDVQALGEEISHHCAFQPSRTNVSFISISDDNEVVIRTYERGVEAETLACGTGAAAAAIVAHLLKNIQSPVTVKTRLGQFLKFEFDASQNKILNLTMTGPAKLVFHGTVNLHEALLNF